MFLFLYCRHTAVSKYVHVVILVYTSQTHFDKFISNAQPHIWTCQFLISAYFISILWEVLIHLSVSSYTDRCFTVPFLIKNVRVPLKEDNNLKEFISLRMVWFSVRTLKTSNFVFKNLYFDGTSVWWTLKEIVPTWPPTTTSEKVTMFVECPVSLSGHTANVSLVLLYKLYKDCVNS